MGYPLGYPWAPHGPRPQVTNLPYKSLNASPPRRRPDAWAFSSPARAAALPGTPDPARGTYRRTPAWPPAAAPSPRRRRRIAAWRSPDPIHARSFWLVPDAAWP